MKYLAALKSEIPITEKSENTQPDELQKVQKTLFTVFTPREGGTFEKKNKTHDTACGECKHAENIPGVGVGCVYRTSGDYPNIWTLLDSLDECPRGYWN